MDVLTVRNLRIKGGGCVIQYVIIEWAWTVDVKHRSLFNVQEVTSKWQ